MRIFHHLHLRFTFPYDGGFPLGLNVFVVRPGYRNEYCIEWEILRLQYFSFASRHSAGFQTKQKKGPKSNVGLCRLIDAGKFPVGGDLSGSVSRGSVVVHRMNQKGIYFFQLLSTAGCTFCLEFWLHRGRKNLWNESFQKVCKILHLTKLKTDLR